MAALLAEAEAAVARLRAYVFRGDVANPAVPPLAWPVLPDDPDLISVAAAAERSRQSVGTIRRWCRHDEIGRKYGKDWLVSRARLAARLGA